ncbi:hypothetical protein ACFYT3_07835 [Nocardia amikacinitolerans]|uniref:hypothetical protein n=1 Tax=Nocardia amikacinitolerans TaxID=756689 RepID=UPI003680DC5C
MPRPTEVGRGTSCLGARSSSCYKKEVAVADTAFKSARLPVSPSATPAIPAPPANSVVLPASPVSFVAGKYIPVVVPFIRADMAGDGALFTVATAKVVTDGTNSGAGRLSMALAVHVLGLADFGSSGSANARVAGGAATVVVVSAGFGGDGHTMTTNAVARGGGELSAVVVPTAGAVSTFHGTATVIGVLPPPVETASAPLSGGGSLTAAVVPGFSASGMNKSGTQPGPNAQNAWIQVISWTADTANYPGSTVDTNALLAKGAKASAAIAGSVGWTQGTYPNSISARLKQNGVVVATGTPANPALANATVAVAAGDRFTLEVSDGSGWAAYSAATINAGNTYLRIT